MLGDCDETAGGRAERFEGVAAARSRAARSHGPQHAAFLTGSPVKVCLHCRCPPRSVAVSLSFPQPSVSSCIVPRGLALPLFNAYYPFISVYYCSWAVWVPQGCAHALSSRDAVQTTPPNHRKAYAMPSYLSHPPYVLLPPLPPLPPNHLSISPNHSSNMLLSPRARHGRTALLTSAPLPTSIEQSDLNRFVPTV